jgi:DNA-binding GntR family transcriptional regulator
MLKPDQSVEGQTQASMAYSILRTDIINSTLRPGFKLRIRDLCKKYRIGSSSVREALNRLSGDGLVTLVDLKGFSVNPINQKDLSDLTKARCWLNECALRESISVGDQEWEERILLAYHRMSRTPRFGSESGLVSPAWEVAHRLFHASLISACGSQWVLKFCEQLFDAADRYRYLSREAQKARKDDHREIMEATLNRDADLASKLLTSHFSKTAELCKKMIEDTASSKRTSKPRIRKAGSQRKSR